MSSRVVIVEFPGSSAAEVADSYNRVLGISAQVIWHDTEAVPTCDLLVIPGGSAFCDYLRPGALVKTSPIAAPIRRYSRIGKMLGIGNGFQIMCELGILPGALLRNGEGHFINEDVYVVAQDCSLKVTPLSRAPRLFPLACEFGCFYLDRRNLTELEANKLVAFSYSDKEGDILQAPPTGSVGAIAGLTNQGGNVLGVMFHPERAVEQSYGGEQGREVLTCLLS